MGTDHFDSVAADWDSDPDKVSRAAQVAAGVLASVAPDPGARLLEYGAGTGLVTQFLQERVGQVVLADNSSGMRQVIEAKIASGVLPPAQVWDLDLEHAPAPDEQFDLVVTSMVLHHVRDLPTVLTRFAALLRPGGHLCIADLDREDGSFHQHDFDGHHGFDRAELSKALMVAGFGSVQLVDCTTILKEGVTYQVFLATARR